MSQCDPNNPCDACKAPAAVPVDPPPPEIVRQTSGPFKGRVYERRPGGGLVRRHDLEASDRAELRRRQLEELHRQTMRTKGTRRVQEVSMAEFRNQVRRS